MNHIKTIRALIITSLGFVITSLIVFIGLWHSPSINKNYTQDIPTCIATSSNTHHMHTKNFALQYIENSPSTCISPSFPIIHIAALKNCNAWLHVVHTDSLSPTGTSNWLFIDAHESLFPFYAFSTDFYDSPCWNYTLYKKELSYWKGHAYAVQVDKITKTINRLGGIEWGYKLPLLSIRPQAIIPRELAREEQVNDWILLSHALIGYTIQ